MTYSCHNCGGNACFNGFDGANKPCQSEEHVAHEFKCRKCKEICESPTALFNHMQTVHAHRCGECAATFQQAGDLERHDNLHHQQRFECEECKGLFDSKVALQLHKDSAHATFHRCSYCPAVFLFDAIDLDQHIKNHHPPLLRCEQCPEETFSTAEACEAHFLAHHGETVTCEHCIDMFFLNSVALDRHIAAHHGDTIDCEKCIDTFFPTREALYTHTALYHGQRFTCGACPNTFFITEKARNSHIKATHCYKCPTCPQVFNHEFMLIDHLLLDHAASGKEVCRRVLFGNSQAVVTGYNNEHTAGAKAFKSNQFIRAYTENIQSHAFNPSVAGSDDVFFDPPTVATPIRAAQVYQTPTK